MNDLIPISLTPNQAVYLNNSEISVALMGIDISDFNKFQFNLIKVDVDYDFYESTIMGYVNNSVNVLPSLIATINVKSEGIYYISSLKLFEVDTASNELIKQASYDNNDFKTRPFKILLEDIVNSLSLSIEQVLDERVEILKKRDLINNKGIGRKNEINKEYQIYIFCKNVLMTISGFYDQIELIPFDGIGYSDIVTYLNKFLSSKQLPVLPYPLKENELLTDKNPGLIFHFPIVFAKDKEEAGTIAEKEVMSLLKTLALTRMSYGAIVGEILIDKETQTPYQRVYGGQYTGNLLTGLDFGENPRKNKQIFNKIKTDDTINFCLTIFSECLNEKNLEVAYSKLWSILEILAEKKKPNLLPSGKFYLDGNKIKNKYNPTTKDFVRELVRYYMKNNSHINSSITNNSLVNNPDDLLTIWYRHRNCLVHSGGCRPDDILYCKISKPDYETCNKAHNHIFSVNKSRTIDNDDYFNLLKQTIRLFLFDETK